MNRVGGPNRGRYGIEKEPPLGGQREESREKTEETRETREERREKRAQPDPQKEKRAQERAPQHDQDERVEGRNGSAPESRMAQQRVAP